MKTGSDPHHTTTLPPLPPPTSLSHTYTSRTHTHTHTAPHHAHMWDHLLQTTVLELYGTDSGTVTWWRAAGRLLGGHSAWLEFSTCMPVPAIHAMQSWRKFEVGGTHTCLPTIHATFLPTALPAWKGGTYGRDLEGKRKSYAWEILSIKQKNACTICQEWGTMPYLPKEGRTGVPAFLCHGLCPAAHREGGRNTGRKEYHYYWKKNTCHCTEAFPPQTGRPPCLLPTTATACYNSATTCIKH